MMELTENTFRGTLLLIFSLFMLIWLRSFFLTGRKRSSYYSKEEGLLPGLSFRVLLSMSTVGIVLYLIEPGWMSWGKVRIPGGFRLAGVLPGIVGLTLLVLSIRALGRNFFASLKLREDHELILKGPYRYVKHPMYISFIMMWLCFFLLTDNWFIGLTGLATYIIIFAFRVPREERMLRERFGAGYSKKNET